MASASIDAILRANGDLFLAILVVAVGIVAGFLLGRASERVLLAVGLDDAVEGTSFERTAQGLGTSTVVILSRLLSWFLYVTAIVVALRITRLRGAEAMVMAVVDFLPRLLVASLVLIGGVIVGDKIEVLLSERLRGVKFPLATGIPPAVRLTVVFLAALIALGHLGLATGALLILLAAYLFGAVLLAAVAFRDLLASGAAGTYLLLRQPYTIGDEVVIDDRQGIVQEVGLFVTHIESEDRELVMPNRTLFRGGVVRIREE